MMILLPALCCLYLVSLLHGLFHSRPRAVSGCIVLMTAAAVLIAELTSLFTAYHIIAVSACWCLLLLGAAFLHQRAFQTPLPRLRAFFSLPISLSKRERTLLLLMLCTVLFVVLKMFLNPPSVPSDATSYHQPRAFMYYKNQSIHNYPCSYGHMLYFGPLNAIVISQMQILCFGWDRLSALVQFSAYLLAITSVYEAARLLCKSRPYALVGAALVCFMPMAHLQASTMQSDLMVTAYCAAAISQMAQIFYDLRENRKPPACRFALLGLCCGLAVLSKLSAGPTLIGCALCFALLLLIKRRRYFLRDCLIILCCVLLMTCGFWVRNALDWNGDFLPVSYAGARPNYQEMGMKRIVLLSVKALSTPLNDPTKDTLPPFSLLRDLSLWVAKSAADLLQLDMHDPATEEGGVIYTGYTSPTPDHVSYPLHALLLLLALPAALLYAILQKKWWLLAYALCCLQALLITSFQYQWCSSVNRYLMPSYVISLPLCTYMLQRFVGNRRFAKTLVSLLLAGMLGLTAMASAYFPYKYLRDIFVEKHTADERLLSEHFYYPLELWHQVLTDIEQNQYTKIGLFGNAFGDYIWMRPFASPQYEVRYINALFHSELEAADYIPDCIIAGLPAKQIPETLRYHGAEYIRKFDESAVCLPAELDLKRFVYYIRTAP